MVRAFLFWTACCAAFARDPISIQGQVINAITGEPVKKAVVSVAGLAARAEPRVAFTDAAGNFEVGGLEPGAYRIIVERAGYVRKNWTGEGQALRAATNVSGLVLKLVPQAVIAGRIVDEDGEPAEGATVSSMRWDYSRGHRQLIAVATASADDQGEYRLHGLAPGRYVLMALARRAGASSSVPVFYPNAFDASTAATLTLSAGAVLRGIDLAMPELRTVRVTGKVLDAGGRPAANVQVTALGESNSRVSLHTGAVSTSGDGSFLLPNLRPGAYLLVAESWDKTERQFARQSVLVSADGLDGVTLALAPPLTVTGRIQVEDSPMEITAGSVMLEPLSDTSGSNTVGGGFKGSSTFTVSNVAPDNYSVQVFNVPLNVYLKSVRLGNEDALLTGLNLTRGVAGAIELVLSGAAASIDVTVVDARQQLVAQATVVAVPQGPRAAWRQFYAAAFTDTSGHALLQGLGPGDYKLYAWENVANNAWLDPEFLSSVESRAESISIAEKARETKQLTVIPDEGK